LHAATIHTDDDVFYRVPPVPEFIRNLPVQGRWQAPDQLPSNWAATHFLEAMVRDRTLQVLERHASSLKDGVVCHVDLHQVIAGGQHVVVPLNFADGDVWVARVSFPACAENEQHQCCRGGFDEYLDEVIDMESEIATLQLVASTTSVPVPKLFGYNLECQNTLGGPYMLCEMIDGETVEQLIARQGGIFRSQVRSLVDEMTEFVFQLSQLRFDGIGRLRFGESPKSPRLAPLRQSNKPHLDAVEYFTQRFSLCCPPSGQTEHTVPLTSMSWVTSTDDERVGLSASIYHRTAQFFARKFSSGPFPLQHIDLNQQNIIVDKNCRVRAIVDWENARTAPFEVYDIQSRKLFKQRWQQWEGLDWVDGVALEVLCRLENTSPLQPKLSVVHDTLVGSLGGLLEQPFVPIQYVEGLPNLVEFLYRILDTKAQKIVPQDLAKEILGHCKDGSGNKQQKEPGMARKTRRGCDENTR